MSRANVFFLSLSLHRRSNTQTPKKATRANNRKRRPPCHLIEEGMTQGGLGGAPRNPPCLPPGRCGKRTPTRARTVSRTCVNRTLLHLQNAVLRAGQSRYKNQRPQQPFLLKDPPVKRLENLDDWQALCRAQLNDTTRAWPHSRGYTKEAVQSLLKYRRTQPDMERLRQLPSAGYRVFPVLVPDWD